MIPDMQKMLEAFEKNRNTKQDMKTHVTGQCHEL